MSKPSIKPYNSLQSKKDQVKHMFNMIASKYDVLNHTLSLGMDYVWRKKAIKKILNNPKEILDMIYIPHFMRNNIDKVLKL